MSYRTERAFAALIGYAPRRSPGQRIASAVVYILLGGLAVWAGAGIAVGIVHTLTGA